MSLTNRPFADSTDVILADEDNNSLPTYDANREMLRKLAMQVAPPIPVTRVSNDMVGVQI